MEHTTNCPLCGDSYPVASIEERADPMRRCTRCHREIIKGVRPDPATGNLRDPKAAGLQYLNLHEKAQAERQEAQQLVRVALGCLERGETASALRRLVDAAGMLASTLSGDAMGKPVCPTGRGYYVQEKA